MIWIDLYVFVGLMATLGCVTRIALALVSRRRDALPRKSEDTLAEIAARLARVEQAVDATALEVERMAEGQRFTARLLAERAEARVERSGPDHRAPLITPH